MLQLFDFDVSDWQASIKPFSRTKIEASTKPYTSEEWSALVKRTQLFFFSLVTKLIAFKEENPEAPPPAILDEIIVNREDNRDITITVGKESKGEAKDGAASPFNQCMAAAYTLFAYYTAFNDTVIKDIRHPIQVVTPKSEGRTSKTVQVRGYKGRAAKDVHALFAASEENEHKEATETAAGFIVADINKRDSVGSVDGITFIQTLELFSKTYSDDPFDTLIYFLNKEGKKTTIDMHHSLIYLSENLNLLSVRRGELTEHLIKTYTDIVENNTETTFCWTKREDGARVMNRQRIVMTKRSVTHQATPIAYTAISCMTDRSLRNALLPLTYSEKDAQGAITISFRYLDDSTGNFLVPAKYKTFLQLVEKYAAYRNTLPTGGRGSSSPPPFLLPLGSKTDGTYQWREGNIPISSRMLRSFGIGYGDYFLNINSSRIRVTHSNLEYKPEENGLTAQQILQHSIDTADKNYRNGHPDSNKKQMSQALMGLTYIAWGKTRNEALNLVKQKLNIPILEYDAWKKLNQPTNPNGISCDGKIDLKSEKDWHYAARKFAESHGIIEKGQDITCFQYDLCVFCKSAKLVDDPFAIYKLLSFLDALGESIDQYPERASVIQMKIERFQVHLEDLLIETLEQAKNLLEEKGRYPLFNSLSSVIQYI